MAPGNEWAGFKLCTLSGRERFRRSDKQGFSLYFHKLGIGLIYAVHGSVPGLENLPEGRH
jgi:hypothetical protein